MKDKKISVRKMTVTAIMSAISAVLMFLEFSVPIVPSFLKFDFSDLPAVITAFAVGPVWGVIVELLKNLIHLPFTQTSGVGELANFIIGALLVFPAGLVYKLKKDRGGALIGSLSGAFVAALVSVPVNYFITYPFYTNFMPMDAIIGAYKAIVPAADTLIKALLIFNVPFTFVKGLVCVVITFVVYKKLSPVIKGKK
ncbi:MAG: ECF transporter S component [Clostridia bacterium]|nr:ECF transporter S component [Clostridia bacterium]